jgi:hypothetical protein
MTKFFFTEKNGKKSTPHSKEQLQALIERRVITQNTPLETDTGHKGYAGKVPGLNWDGDALPATSNGISIIPSEGMASIAVPASVKDSFAVTQGTWRFLANDRVTPLALVEPLRHFARQQLAGTRYALAVIDWSKVDYGKHPSKKDIVQLTHQYDVGYELTTHLLVNAQNGSSIAPIQMHVKTANGFLSTAETVPAAADHHLAQVLPMMRDADAMELPTTLVHVIDREADSVFHLREWSAAGFLFLVRGDDRLVQWRGEPMKYSTIEKRLETEGAFRKSREVTIKGKSGVQYITEASIVLDRPPVGTLAAGVGLGNLEATTARHSRQSRLIACQFPIEFVRHRFGKRIPNRLLGQQCRRRLSEVRSIENRHCANSIKSFLDDAESS